MEKDHVSNGWTQYQKLVLSQLETHEKKQDILQKELNDQRLLIAGMIHDLRSNSDDVKEVLGEIKKAGDARGEQLQELNGLKWKVGAIITGISTVASIVFSAIIKFFFLH